MLQTVLSFTFTSRSRVVAYRRFVIAFSLIVLVLPAFGQAPEKAAPESPALTRMKKDLYFLASPECEGRGPGTQGIDLAADYIVRQLVEAGLKPGVKNEYYQPFTIGGPPVLGKPNLLNFKGPDNKAAVPELDKDFRVMGLSGKGKIDAPLVFVGYGLQAKNLKYDEYAGIDVAGKIVVMLRHTPRWNDKEMPFGGEDRDKWASLEKKIATAESSKAAAIILINDSTELPKDELLSFSYLTQASSSRIPVVQVKREVMGPIIANGLGMSLAEIEKGIDDDLKPRSGLIKDWTAAMDINVARSKLPVKNVVAVLPGSGPLAKEIIVVGAHYDHLGYGGSGSLAKNVKGKVIHHGADDNASGTTAMIELARRFGAQKDRQGRTLVFMAFSAEERGLLGSLHYVKEPLFPLADTVAMLNLDMVGKLRPDSTTKLDNLLVQGVGTGKGFDQLVEKLKTPSFHLAKTASGMGPSDHQSFNQKKIPVLFFYTGSHPDYHKPSDTADGINLDGMTKVVDYVEKIATELASEPQRREYVEVKGGPSKSGGPNMPKMGIAPGYDEDKPGLLVTAVSEGGAAEKGGLKAGDIIVEIGGKNVTNIETYMVAMSEQKAGEVVAVVVVRNDKKLTLKVTPR